MSLVIRTRTLSDGKRIEAITTNEHRNINDTIKYNKNRKINTVQVNG